MRDLERWKDQVELSLDGRQIFFLFFGSACLACLVFIAGVLVGKRIEQRALAAVTPVAADPLAALDRAGDDADDGLTFREALAKGEGRAEKKARRPDAKAAKPDGKTDPKGDPKPDAKPDKKADARPDKKAADARPDKKADARPDKKAADARPDKKAADAAAPAAL